MNDHDLFWKLEKLSNRQLLERLGSVLGSSRRLMAELVAHLGEVEERGLHLAAACSSMFAYCLKLGMTEDEAYRRMEVARLARRYPAIFPLLAAGRVTISAVALLKHHLSEENHLELLAAVDGKTVVQTRELIAARFPRPDVPASVRKLPERRVVMQPSLAMSTPAAPRGAVMVPHGCGTQPLAGTTHPSTAETAPSSSETEPGTGGTEPRATEPRATAQMGAAQPPHSRPAVQPRVASRVEPLSAQRYRVQFTASAELARKLELARDLMRHTHPGGELGPVVERALDLLIENLMQRRFGKTKKADPKRTTEPVRPGTSEKQGKIMEDGAAMRGVPTPAASTHRSGKPDTAQPATSATLASGKPDTAEPATSATLDTAEAATATLDTAGPAAAVDPAAADDPAAATPNTAALDTVEHPCPTTLDTAEAQRELRGELARASLSSYIPRSTRRAVIERDGLGCSWVDEHGAGCGARAWLEYDHRHPRAKGGGSEADNLRLLCRSHNRFAAEREYGRKHIEQTIAEHRRQREERARGAREREVHAI